MFVAPIAYMGTQEILLVAVVLVVLFGGTKIPQLARGIGQGIRELKTGLEGKADPPPPLRPATTRTAPA